MKGRPPKLNKEMIKDICGFVENGSTFKDACILCDISETSFYDWKNKGIEDCKNKKVTIYADFIESLKKAEIKFKAYHVQKIMQASQHPSHWTASAWLLERKFRDEFGKDKQEIEINGELTLVIIESLLSKKDKVIDINEE